MGVRLYFVTLAANTAHAMVGALVTLQLAGNVTAVFEFTETTAAPGNIAVVIVNGDTAAQCATALETALGLYFAATFGGVPFFGAVGTNPVQVVIGQAAAPQIALAVGATLPITVTNNGGRQYGDPLLRSASKAFIFNNYDPNAVSVFGVVGDVPPDIVFMFWPLTPVIPKAFPQPIINTTANEKPEG